MTLERYNRVYASLWAESWDDDMRLLGLYLLTGPHRRTEGIYRLPLEYAAGDMKWPIKKVRAVLARLDGFVEYDEDAQLVLLPNALKRNGMNPKQRIGAVKAFRELPPSPLLERFESLSKAFSKDLAEALLEPSHRNGHSVSN